MKNREMATELGYMFSAHRGEALVYDTGQLVASYDPKALPTLARRQPSPPVKPRRYSWSRSPDAKLWKCKETGETVTEVQIANADLYGDFSEFPASFRPILIRLLKKPTRCKHENKLDITAFGDPESRYTCPDCGWSTPKPPVPEVPSALDDLRVWVAEQEGVVASWKAEAKVKEEETRKMYEEADEAIRMVFDGTSR